MIRIRDVSFKYSTSKMMNLDRVSAEIPKGVYGLLGQNGAGKTTLLKLLATLIPIQQGTINVNSIDVRQNTNLIRPKIGYLPQKFEFFEHLTSYEMLEYIAILKNIESKNQLNIINGMLEMFNLADKKHDKIKSLSGGMKQRLAIAQSLIGDPDIIILDEPTVGLDPIERLRFKNIINEIKNDKIIIISTHIISDVTVLCNNIGIMNKGRLLYSGNIDDLLKKLTGKVYIQRYGLEEQINHEDFPALISLTRKKSLMEVRYISENEKEEFSCEPSLEDAYFYIMNGFMGGSNE